MATFLLDTDTLSLFQRDHPTVLAAVAAHSTDIVAICTTTLDEQIGGWSAIARSAKTSQSHEHAAAFLVGLVTSWQSFALAPQTVASLTRFDQLRKAKLNVVATTCESPRSHWNWAPPSSPAITAISGGCTGWGSRTGRCEAAKPAKA